MLDRLVIAIILIIIFEIGLYLNLLSRMGPGWFDHAMLVILIVPGFLPLQVLGGYLYFDDFMQHFIRRWRYPAYESPVHLTVTRLGLWRFRSWLIDKTGWQWLERI